MKRLFCLSLSILLILSLFAGCAASQPKDTTANSNASDASDASEVIEHALKVGYARVDISPTASVPLTGYGDTDSRFSKFILDPIYATCIAFTDESDNTVLLFHMDLCGSDATVIGMARASISRATGLPVGNIMVSATHNHSSPAIQVTSDPAIADYNAMVKQRMKDAAIAALEDRKNAEMYITSTQLEGMNFTRHYVMNDGSVRGDNFSGTGTSLVGHVREADNTLQIVKFVREGGQDVVLVNWQAHPHRVPKGDNYNAVSSDIVGAMRDYMEENMNCLFAYFTGASGDVNSGSRISSENKTDNYLAHGQLMGQYAIDASANFRKVDVGTAQILENIYTAKPKKEGMSVNDLNLYAFSIGDTAFICAPYEMFSENGEAIKANSPFEMTFVVTCANAANKYIPSYTGFDYNGKLSYEGNTSRYAKGTGELLVTEYVNMLNELYATKQ